VLVQTIGISHSVDDVRHALFVHLMIIYATTSSERRPLAPREGMNENMTELDRCREAGIAVEAAE